MPSHNSVAPETALDVAMEAAAITNSRVTNKKPSDGQRLLFRRSDRTNKLMHIGIRSIGSCVPDRIVDNSELETAYGFEPGWIERRTGIKQRRYAADDEGTSDLAVRAARKAIEKADVDPADIDLLLIGTFTPDYTCPSTACLVQQKLGLDAPAVDLQAACSGFMYALATGAQFVATGNSKLALVIGADINSRIVEPSDKGTAPLFGDGAGAVLLEAGSADQGLVCYQLGADGAGGGMLDRPVGGTSRPITAESVAAGQHFLKMDGRNVFKWAIQAVTDSIETVMRKADVCVDDVKLFVLHQANIRIIDHAMKVLNIPPEKVFNNLDRVGNTSAASIPLALDEAVEQGNINPGDLVLMCGFGAGLTWGTGLFRW
ncbi:3-oxoacyl-ACP synthase III family protein [Fuerstiella marisgermanici]|uniref:Beta-ketoacyl-[acyl-carrier-protein] synthase III n=1 Tax=Fuerstiella marisgermanici TaxID=1891926 RepID=A0A1P8W9U9_9PLAN|nr:beta-ketoacyl-ACP synthase III [Fuerstiella marisgermanici]APZ90837.1 3-oxoacyl-[acyl-carrier-protein] synthase 3 [Fuerstiella marisgermanici]